MEKELVDFIPEDTFLGEVLSEKSGGKPCCNYTLEEVNNIADEIYELKKKHLKQKAEQIQTYKLYQEKCSHLADILTAQNLTSFRGKKHTFSVSNKSIYKVDNYKIFKDYLEKNDNDCLLTINHNTLQSFINSLPEQERANVPGTYEHDQRTEYSVQKV